MDVAMKGSFMRCSFRIAVSIVIIAAVGCSPSSPTRPSEVATGRAAALPAWFTVATAPGGAAGLRSSAVIDGFRVHPDPGDDGVIRVFEGENVVVNATDIASRPPAPQSYLVVNWGDGPNQRVGCGPCRQDHGYAPGRYTLVASLDGTASDRSISVPVQVSPARERDRRIRGGGPVQPFELGIDEIAVGETVFLVLPLFLPPDVSAFLFMDCEPVNAAIFNFGGIVFNPPTVALPIVGQAPGTCTVFVFGDDDGEPFEQNLTFTVH
jgi:hypothetical protein